MSNIFRNFNFANYSNTEIVFGVVLYFAVGFILVFGLLVGLVAIFG